MVSLTTNLKTEILKRLLKYLQEHSNTGLANRVQRIAGQIYRSTNNPNYHMELNGEFRVLNIISEYFEHKIFFDVGANVGHWSLAAAKSFEGKGKVYSFEPCSRTYESLAKNSNDTQAIHCFNIGLSDCTGSKEILFSERNPEKSSVEMCAVESLNKRVLDYKAETQKFLRGDEFCGSNSIDEITFLKIDTEGHDFKVLDGFRDTLRAGKIRVIQFEYNRLNIYARTFLHDFYELLSPSSSHDGYLIGRVFPHSVRFKQYDPLDENFIDGNFIAVQQSLGTLIKHIQN